MNDTMVIDHTIQHLPIALIGSTTSIDRPHHFWILMAIMIAHPWILIYMIAIHARSGHHRHIGQLVHEREG